MLDTSIRTITCLDQVNSALWDALDHGHSPFMRYGFLRALEESQSVGEGTGWQPVYILAEQGDTLIGACAAYLKTDSYGEYIFDWAWARAASQFGQPYYPKLVVAAPFTPASGQRLLVQPGSDREHVVSALLAGIVELMRQLDLSGAHLLFCTDQEATLLEERGMARRASYQFHWFNRQYDSFECFLERLKSRKRKQIRKERRAAQAAVDRIEFVPGSEMSPDDFSALDRFYRRTVSEHGGYDYLQRGFFELVARSLPETMLFARATKDDRVVAGAVFFETQSALYGRYWGADQDLEFLHFEVAYYAGIERCIEKGLTVFEAGAQGQHKLMRGFEPTLTHSCHLMSDRKFDRAIRGFLEQEKLGVTGQMTELAATGPFRNEEGP